MKTPIFPLHIRSILLLITLVFFISCKKSQPVTTPVQPSATPPVITTILPVSGSYQTAVTIYGSGFNYDNSKDSVFFNGMAALTTSATANQLKVTVPLGAGTGNITVHANGLVSNGTAFTYRPAEIVTVLAGSHPDSGVGTSVDGTGISASFTSPSSVALDAAGNLYVCDANLIREISPAGVVTTLAGNIAPGFADGPAKLASFNGPRGIAVDASGNVYIADSGNNRIRKILPSGLVFTLAGNGQAGFANGSGGAASFNSPYGIAVDALGNLYVSEWGNRQIRKITAGGAVTTYFSPITAPLGIAVDATGSNVYVGNAYGVLEKITPSGNRSFYEGKGYGPSGFGTTAAPVFDHPYGLSIDATGNIYVNNSGRPSLIQKIATDGSLTTLVGGGDTPITSQFAPLLGTNAAYLGGFGIAVDAAGNLYVDDTGDFSILKIFVK